MIRDYVGIKVGVLTVEKYSHNDGSAKAWKTRCVCGKTRILRTSEFKRFSKYTECKCRFKHPGTVVIKWSGQKGRCRICDKRLPVSKYFYCVPCTPQPDYYDIFEEYNNHA